MKNFINNQEDTINILIIPDPHPPLLQPSKCPPSPLHPFRVVRRHTHLDKKKSHFLSSQICFAIQFSTLPSAVMMRECARTSWRPPASERNMGGKDGIVRGLLTPPGRFQGGVTHFPPRDSGIPCPEKQSFSGVGRGEGGVVISPGLLTWVELISGLFKFHLHFPQSKGPPPTPDPIIWEDRVCTTFWLYDFG